MHKPATLASLMQRHGFTMTRKGDYERRTESGWRIVISEWIGGGYVALASRVPDMLWQDCRSLYDLDTTLRRWRVHCHF